MQQRTIPQNRKFGAMVGDVAKRYPLTPWRKTLAREAWKRFFLAVFAAELRSEARANGWPDPFPAGVARSSELDSRQMGELIECTYAQAAMLLGLVLE
jgi:hypothetical protein